jgi:hypothetical protein
MDVAVTEDAKPESVLVLMLDVMKIASVTTAKIQLV